jgi:death-on-curing protein
MKRLTTGQVVLLHQMLLDETGGLDGLRDEGLLDSALNVAFQTFDGQDLYPSLLTKAARIGFALVCNHPFTDGNKRIGILAMMVFLELNGIVLDCTDDDLIALGLGLADGSLSATQLEDWIHNHT